MKISIIYDNTSSRIDLQADWGFSALVEAHGKKILFDTGADGSILMANMAVLNIAPRSIDAVFISHPHLDHTGGLSAFLAQNPHAALWIPRSFHGPEHRRTVIEITQAAKLCEGLYSTGELAGIEQSLCVETPKGIVVVAGCSHPPMPRILRAAAAFGNVYGIAGGLHGTPPESLANLQLICATHCTRYKDEIKSRYPRQYVEGGAGKIIALHPD